MGGGKIGENERNVPLEVTRLPDVDHLGQNQGRGLGHGAGCADGINGTKDGLEEDGGSAGDGGVLHGGSGRLVGRRHNGFLPSLALASPEAEPGWSGSGAGSLVAGNGSRSNNGRNDKLGAGLGGDVDVSADDGNFLVLGLPDHVHFHYSNLLEELLTSKTWNIEGYTDWLG